ncbi:MAG: hypothetical protein IPJ51_03290 [Saprospiraceae bacterium]|jgi:hypothetical protein|nr:hypothetical protein [Saprospiraceae bacterium]
MKTLILSILIFSYTFSHGQMRGGTEYIDNYAKLMTKKAKGPQLLGSVYVLDEWHSIEVMLKDGIAKIDKAKLNLQTSNIDVLYKDEEKEILFKDYDYVNYSNKGIINKYIPAPKYKSEGQALSGFVEILGEGQEKVLINHYNYVRKANSDAKIIGGETDDKLIKKTDIYILKNKKLFEVKKKKDVLEYYKSRSSEVENYIKKEKLDVKNPLELVLLVGLMNSNQDVIDIKN